MLYLVLRDIQVGSSGASTIPAGSLLHVAPQSYRLPEGGVLTTGTRWEALPPTGRGYAGWVDDSVPIGDHDIRNLPAGSVREQSSLWG